MLCGHFNLELRLIFPSAGLSSEHLPCSQRPPSLSRHPQASRLSFHPCPPCLSCRTVVRSPPRMRESDFTNVSSVRAVHGSQHTWNEIQAWHHVQEALRVWLGLPVGTTAVPIAAPPSAAGALPSPPSTDELTPSQVLRICSFSGRGAGPEHWEGSSLISLFSTQLTAIRIVKIVR